MICVNQSEYLDVGEHVVVDRHPLEVLKLPRVSAATNDLHAVRHKLR